MVRILLDLFHIRTDYSDKKIVLNRLEQSLKENQNPTQLDLALPNAT